MKIESLQRNRAARIVLALICISAYSLASAQNFPNKISYNQAAVCDFIYARISESNDLISDEAGNRPPIQSIKIKAVVAPLFRYEYPAVSVDFFIINSTKKIHEASFDPPAIYPSDRGKNHLLSRPWNRSKVSV